MQADGKFYCYTCSFETGARPKRFSSLPPERAALVERMDDAIVFLDKIAGWPEDDWQGLKYYAYQTAESLREAAAALRGETD